MGRAIVTVLTVSLLACGGVDEAPRESADDALIGGALTGARPEIGFVSIDGHGSCTATLVAPDAVITAAHCVSYETQAVEGRYGWLGLDTAGGRQAYTIDRYLSLGRELGDRDLALMHLATPVAAAVARPATIAAATPGREAAVVVYGYGCLERETRSGSFAKRAAPAVYRDSQRLCPGDSGGPVTLGEDGPIVAINSGYYVQAGDDIFADPVAHRAALQAQIDAWGPPPPSDRLRIRNASGGPLWARCDGPSGEGCDGWVYVAAGASAQVSTFRRRLVLDNQGRVVGFPLASRALLAPSLDVTVYANAADPFAPAEAPSACLGGDSSNTAALAPFDGEGQVCPARDAWFALSIDAGTTIEIEATFAHADGDIDLALFGPDGAQLARSDTTTDREVITQVVARDGVHRVRVYGYRGVGNTVRLRIAAGD